MIELSTIQQIAVWILPVIFAITLHEAAHGYVANYFGDGTAKMLGRVSFNPLHHFDLVGTLIIPLLVLLLSHFNFVFGWAKPVPINSRNLRRPQDIAWVTLAGPMANLLMAIGWTLLFKLGLSFSSNTTIGLFVLLTARAGMVINLLLFFFNLLPIPPLDGSKILSVFLPSQQAIIYQKIEPYGFYILLILLFTGSLNTLIGVPINWAINILRVLFNL